MAFQKLVQVDGDSKSYEINAKIKKYSLLDLGFVKTNNGVYNLERSLDPTSPYNQGIKLKVSVSKDLDGLKMSTVTGNGLRAVNIFKREEDQPLVEQYHYLLNSLIDREVLKVHA
ncbi:DUF1831 domain-containing protein [Pediococcus claussenii]|uniref:Cysteine desulfurase n=1 Tax=Pediococcus claussenii (strain ATCC BAA-344 / DSM 14800 / JCM 18046 / KCTC 3811 / LMG 21948 / P06) TaxID=701521 RepID=G8PCV7_PEDCP|nr:DUF1831 domain-containing protein [Pediococcus claussenii]AEV95092.1 hypothetical protein PECL_819 [Pediococcus claussenii ATCC BAA-344]ANZ70280.1 cysteine desulfurase [Pediococcus claussenii]ANZ72096.1 cysteine desulfurase [Pediococcus claussenii]KRN18953.1 hypothetical protein IV79_GL001797 [Pediococcus claussenii]